MRLFLGIEIDDAVRRRAAAIADAAEALVSGTLVVRWIAAENLHITLWFLGEVAEARVPALLAAVDRPFAVPPFDLRLGGLGAFPPSGVPRVLWLGVRDGAQSLANLHAQLADRLQPLGFAAERRPFSAHLTIGRIKSARAGVRPRDLKRQWSDFPAEAGQCRVQAVTVFRSRLSPRGAAYEALVRVPLQ
jgi:RNA 2',3'-cyclic 3'-phosphodiesterase